MNTQQVVKEVNVIFTGESTDSLPVYAFYAGQYKPQESYITLDLRNGEIDADYSSEMSNSVPFTVFNNVVIRFPIDPCVTGESILAVIDMYKIQLQDFYNESDTELNFQGNEVGIPVCDDADKQEWQEKIRDLQESIEMYSHNFAVNIADNDTFTDAITLTPSTPDLSDYATSVLDSIKEDFFVDSAMDDVEIVSRLIIEMYTNNTECLNKNGMEMLLANIDNYSDQTGYARDDIDEDDIEAAMQRA